MGEITEMMLDGTLCSDCGVFVGDVNEDGKTFTSCGYSKQCEDCKEEDDDDWDECYEECD